MEGQIDELTEQQVELRADDLKMYQQYHQTDFRRIKDQFECVFDS